MNLWDLCSRPDALLVNQQHEITKRTWQQAVSKYHVLAVYRARNSTKHKDVGIMK